MDFIIFQFQACTLDKDSEIKIIQSVTIQGVTLIASSNTAGLSHNRPASTVTFHDSSCPLGNYKGHTYCTFGTLSGEVRNA